MITAKTLLTSLWTQIRREMTIQKPEYVAMKCDCRCEPKQETRQDRIFKAGVDGICGFLLICAVVAVLVF